MADEVMATPTPTSTPPLNPGALIPERQPSSKPWDGGQAFPGPRVGSEDGWRPGGYAGISQRSYLAAHAPDVPSTFARLSVPCVNEYADGRKESGRRPETDLELTVRWRTAYADAMLKALK
jgi:hypothetical protein